MLFVPTSRIDIDGALDVEHRRSLAGGVVRNNRMRMMSQARPHFVAVGQPRFSRRIQFH